MATDVEICNMALGRIGVTMYIASMDEVSKEGRVSRLLYSIVRDRVLEAFNWPFARAEAVLQDIGTPINNWEYRYRYPNDCIKPRQVVCESARNPGAGAEVAFIVIEDQASSAKAIACDSSPATLIYTKRITASNMFSPSFTMAFCWALAAEMVLPLAADAKLAVSCRNAYLQEVREAANHAANGQRDDRRPDDTYVSGRQ